MSELLQDLRYAARQWWRRPGVTLVMVATMALGIGASAGIFSVADSVLLEPLPYREPDRLAIVYSKFPTLGFERFWVSVPEYLEFRRWAKSFVDVGAYRVREASLTGGDRPVRVRSATVSASLFSTLGADPIQGRTFTADEDLLGGPQAVILGQALWERAFAGDPSVVGQSVEVNGAPRTVVGVMPREFDLEDAGVELWLPLAIDPAAPGNRASHFLFMVGRLAPGANLSQARQEVAALIDRWQTEFPEDHAPHPEHHPLVVQTLKEDLVGDVRPAVLLLLGAVGFVLLIACANVANVLLARAETRHREISIRTALGAGHRRLVRQFLTESVLLALVGGALGTLLAGWAVKGLLAANPNSITRLDRVEMDWKVLGFALAVALATGVLFGLAPALHARARTFFSILRDGARASAGGRRLFRASLVVAEVALAAALVVGAGLLVRSFWSLQRVDPGFEAGGLLTFQLSLPSSRYPEPHQVPAFYDDLVERVETLPGVAAATAMSGQPPVREVDAMDTDFQGLARFEGGPPHNVDYYQTVTQGYFEAMGIPLLAGRTFERGDAGDAPPVVVINETMKQVFWPGADPVGQRLRPGLGPDTPWFTVVGVVADVKQGGLDRPTGTEAYFLASQGPPTLGFAQRTMYVMVRAAGGGDPSRLAPSVLAEVRTLDPSLPVAGVGTMEEVLASSVAQPKFLALLVGAFGGLALALAAVGTYGVLSYAVEERRHELGVRLALGARRRALLGLVLGRGMLLVGCGLVLGLGGAWGLSRLMESVLYEVRPGDPLTFAAVPLILAAVALVACLVPARRAVRVDPVETLRVD